MPNELVYCAGGNRRFAQIAIEQGFLYGARLPDTIYFPLHFADQEWKRPNLQAYVEAVARHRPLVATVLDWERDEQLPEVLSWAESVAPYVETVVIIPKVFGGIDRIPRSVAGAAVRLGYSVPTRFGGTSLPVWEFGDRPVHLLGGQPHTQMLLARYLHVVSADGNYAQKMAIKYGQFWSVGTSGAANRHWPKLSEVGPLISEDMPYEAFRRSCINIRAAWNGFGHSRREAIG